MSDTVWFMRQTTRSLSVAFFASVSDSSGISANNQNPSTSCVKWIDCKCFITISTRSKIVSTNLKIIRTSKHFLKRNLRSHYTDNKLLQIYFFRANCDKCSNGFMGSKNASRKTWYRLIFCLKIKKSWNFWNKFKPLFLQTNKIPLIQNWKHDLKGEFIYRTIFEFIHALACNVFTIYES